MSKKNTFFFTPRVAEEICFSWFLLVIRLLFGGLLLMHGINKFIDFDTLSVSFPDPLGVGPVYSLSLAIFAEIACSCAFIAGFLFRLSLLPMIITMLVAFLWVHGGDIHGGELSFVYLMVFILLWVTGPGLFSIDKLLFGKAEKPRYSRYFY